jgi:hypothetical protein
MLGYHQAFKRSTMNVLYKGVVEIYYDGNRTPDQMLSKPDNDTILEYSDVLWTRCNFSIGHKCQAQINHRSSTCSHEGNKCIFLLPVQQIELQIFDNGPHCQLILQEEIPKFPALPQITRNWIRQ